MLEFYQLSFGLDCTLAAAYSSGHGFQPPDLLPRRSLEFFRCTLPLSKVGLGSKENPAFAELQR